MESHLLINLIAGAVVVHEGRVLVVREHKRGSATETVLTQPSGHVERGESLEEGLVRETLEETGYHVRPVAVIGTYLQHFETYDSLRVSYLCELVSPDAEPITDKMIVEALWMTPEELLQAKDQFRSGATRATFEDYAAGIQYPLASVTFLNHRS